MSNAPHIPLDTLLADLSQRLERSDLYPVAKHALQQQLQWLSTLRQSPQETLERAAYGLEPLIHTARTYLESPSLAKVLRGIQSRLGEGFYPEEVELPSDWLSQARPSVTSYAISGV